MLEFKIEFEVYCSCGEELTRSASTGTPIVYYNKVVQNVDTPPCDKCINKAVEEALEQDKAGLENAKVS